MEIIWEERVLVVYFELSEQGPIDGVRLKENSKSGVISCSKS